MTRPGFTVTIANWMTPPGSPTLVTADEVRLNIKKLSSQSGRDGGVRGLNRLATAKLSCGAHSTAACPEAPWPSTVENDDAQIIVQST